MSEFSRKDLKTDRFAVEVGHTIDYLGSHRAQTVRYAGIGLAVVLVIAGGWYYFSQQKTQRFLDLSAAIQVQEAPVGPPQANVPISFPTQQAKDEEALKRFRALISKHSGTEVGYIARYYEGCILADSGKLNDAAKAFEDVSSNGGAEYASLARIALSDIRALAGKPDEAEKLLRQLIASPTALVSKEQATVALARVLAKTKPQEARKLLEPLRTERSAVSQTAISVLSEISN